MPRRIAAMYVVHVEVHVKEGHREQFIAAIVENARNTRREPGNVRFDVLEREQDPLRFLLYEVYRTPEDFAAHQRTPHYLAFKEAVADWMAEPRVGTRYRSLFPADSDW
jgi:autoinducer 2-degrading protein